MHSPGSQPRATQTCEPEGFGAYFGSFFMLELPYLLLIAAGVGGLGFVVVRRARNSSRADELQGTPSPTPELPEESSSSAALPPSSSPSSEPSAAVRAPSPVSMPVDKPRVETRDERESEALAKKKDERERYLAGLTKTRRGFVARLGRVFKGKPKVDEDLKDQIEEILFTADIGSATAQKLFSEVSDELDRKAVADPEAVWEVIRSAALRILDLEPEEALAYDVDPKPYVLLMIGVNGVGKTTTLGKLAARHAEAGRKVLMVAGDTFRAAASEQLEVWTQRSGADLHAGQDRADPSSVIYDGIRRGIDEGYDVVLCDTAGRLHTKKELMDELEKIRRSAAKALSKDRQGEQQPHDTYLVLDATIGQNALAQAKLFKETMDFTGLVLTKLDGTAKGGVVLGVCDELKVPVRYIGIGEGSDDLRRFDPETFIDALLLPDES